jgi:hypothetical protein
MKTKMLVAHWSSDLRFTNLGDGAIVPILDRLNKDVTVLHGRNAPIPEGFPFVLMGIGSVLNTSLAMINFPTKFWGSGIGFDGDIRPIPQPHEILAVRGPVTRDLMGLAPGIPLGDPILLVPQLFPELDPTPNKPSLFIPHMRATIGDIYRRTQVLNRLGVQEYETTLVYEDEGQTLMERIQKILNATFVLTGSLHTFYIRKMFNLGVALCTGGPPISSEIKWRDMFAYYGIQGTVEENTVANLAEGIAWWEEKGSLAENPSLDGLLATLP